MAVVLLTILTAAAGAQEERESRDSESEGGGSFIVVSITAFNEVTFDVKLKNPKTGYVHSVTVTVDVARLLRIGDRVRERRRRGEVILTPIRPREEERQPEPPPGPLIYRPVGYETREPNVPPCIKDGVPPCPRPPEGNRAPRPLRLEKLAGVVKQVHVAAMSFAYVTRSFGLPSKTTCDVLSSGTFTSGSGKYPIGPLKIGGPIVRGNSDKSGNPFHGTEIAGVTTRHRGALVLRDETGLPRIERQTNVYSEGDRMFSADYGVMGGGGLLVYRGQKVSGDDLCCCQAFVDDFKGPKGQPRMLDPDRCGFNAAQFDPGIHIIVAAKGNDVYVLALRGSRQALRDTVFAAGFDDALLLDGGTGAFMVRRSPDPKKNATVVFDGRRDQYPKDPKQSGVNSTRLCITEAP